jgi:hypothetical protein
MTPFTELIRSPALPASPDGSLGDQQRAIDTLFPIVVSASPLRLWQPGDPIAPTGRRLLLGVATWSVPDVTMLDELALALLRQPSDLVVDVFNVADVRSAGDFERYVPGIGTVFHTPVVGLWIDGRLVAKASGKAGRDLVAQASPLGQSAVA